MYMRINQLKEQGFKPTTVAKKLGIHRNTVNRYWNMSLDDFEQMQCRINRMKLLDKYKETILSWLYEHPSMSASQVCDWLKEHYEAYYPDRTVSRYVSELREEFDIPKSKSPRDYEAVDELPMGQQLQIDFGVKWMPKDNGGRIKIYFVCYVLSNSRFKYVEFLDRSFKSIDFVHSTKRCFQHIDGIPKEVVIDQDSILSVDENYGDIIYTYEFEKLREKLGFEVYLCKKSDPESKGKVENAVKYVKNNFLEHRLYPGDIDTLNLQALSWLDRTANGKVHGTTKKIPKDVWRQEREHLQGLPANVMLDKDSPQRAVRKDNTIIYRSNRYSLPLGTYNNHKEVQIETKENKLIISTTTGVFICEHKVSPGRGELIKNTDHKRDKEKSIDELEQKLSDGFEEGDSIFIKRIRKEKPRYVRDQLNLLIKMFSDYGKEQVKEAIECCTTAGLFSATYVRDYLEHKDAVTKTVAKEMPVVPVDNPKYHINTQKRSIEEYGKVGVCNE